MVFIIEIEIQIFSNSKSKTMGDDLNKVRPEDPHRINKKQS